MRLEWLSLVAVSLAVYASVVTSIDHFDTGPSLEKVGCTYLESVGDTHGYPVTKCRLVKVEPDHRLTFAIHQNSTDYTLDVAYIRSTIQILSVAQQ